MIFLTGASGYVGRHVLARLVARGAEVRCLLLADDPIDLSALRGCSVVRGDVTRPDTFLAGGEGVDAIVHAAALMLPNPPEAIRHVNVTGTESMIAFAKHWGIRRFVYVSAVSAVYQEMNSYGLSKREAEQRIAAAGLDFTILRPTMVYGRDGGLHFQKLVALMRAIPAVFPVLGPGRARLQPVSIDDAVTAIVSVLDRPQTIGRSYGVSGATVVSYDELVDHVASALGLRRRKIHLPLPICQLAARALALVSKTSFLSEEALRGVNQNADLDHGDLARDCGYAPATLAEGLRAALGASPAAA